MAFTEAQVKNLEAKLNAKHVRTRRVQDTTLAYVEGWRHRRGQPHLWLRRLGSAYTIHTVRLVWLHESPLCCGLYGKSAHCREGRYLNDRSGRLRQRRS
jgi:hypothetical protein